jgi:CTP synthase (UTP-ammonia lyase)
MSISIAVVGDRDTSLLTHRELDAAIARMPTWAHARWVASDKARALGDVDGVWLAPGTPYRDDDAVYALIERARSGGIPFLGTCGGFQYALVEYARNVAGIPHAAHAETDPRAVEPVVGMLGCSLVGARRTVTPVPGTRLAAICGTDPFPGFHWCNFGLSETWVASMERAGLVVSARAEDAGVEGVELPSHPFFMATLFQPQVGAANGGPLHPLIGAFCAAARERAKAHAH